MRNRLGGLRMLRRRNKERMKSVFFYFCSNYLTCLKQEVKRRVLDQFDSTGGCPCGR